MPGHKIEFRKYAILTRPYLRKFRPDRLQIFCASTPQQDNKHIQRRSLNLLSFRFYGGRKYGKIIKL